MVSNQLVKDKVIRIGCASGFWGDSLGAAKQLIDQGDIDVLVFDYLAEMTLSIMAMQRARNRELGYAEDFVSSVLRDNLPRIAKKGIKVIANAGGLNPQACASAIAVLLNELGLSLNVAVVTGDDIHAQLINWSHNAMEDPFDGRTKPKTLLTANAYLGSHGIVMALEQGADIIITGRCADTALVIAPMIHAFNWSFNDYDHLAQAALAGHLIECGAQCTGGNFTDWESVPDFQSIGYPIVEARADGSFHVTKPKGSGGLISPATLSEQMLYEIDDPAHYVLPDVIADFSKVSFLQLSPHCVSAKGAKGYAPTHYYKVAGTWENGYKMVANILLVGEQVLQKCKVLCDAILLRVNNQLAEKNKSPISHWRVDCIGTGGLLGRPNPMAREGMVILAATHHERAALILLSQEIAQSITSMVPGIASIGGGRPKVSPKIELFTFLYPKSEVTIHLHMQGAQLEITSHQASFDGLEQASPPGVKATPTPFIETNNSEWVEVPLKRIAYARSGDKGDRANIGIIPRTPELAAFLWSRLNEEWMIRSMQHVFSHDQPAKVDRYFLPGIGAINFVLHHALGGGGFASLSPDPQGKTYAQQILTHLIQVPSSLLKESLTHATDSV